MGTNERKGMGGSLVDGLKRRVGAPERSPGRSPAPTPAPAAPERVSEAPTRGGDPSLLADELPELGSFGHVRRRLEATATPGMLGFEFRCGVWVGCPQRPFRPRGLYIVGELHTGDRLSQSLLGVDMRILQSCAGVPAHFFATARSYEQIAKAVADGQELPGWGDWGTAVPGQLFTIRVDGRDGEPLGPDRIDLGMWGLVAV